MTEILLQSVHEAITAYKLRELCVKMCPVYLLEIHWKFGWLVGFVDTRSQYLCVCVAP